MSGEGEGNGGTPPVTTTAPATWLSVLPEDLRADPILNRYADLPAAAKGLIEKEKLVRSSLRLPKDDAPDAEWEAAFKSITPDSIEKYQFPGVPEGQPRDEAMESWFRTAAFEAQIHPRQAAKLVAKYNELVAKRTADYRTEEERGRSALKAEWGSNYEANVALANRAAPDAVKAKLHAVGLNADPDILRWLAGISASRREDGGLGAGATSGQGRSRSAIKQEIDTIASSDAFMGRPGVTQKQHDDAVALYQRKWEEFGQAPA